MIGWISNTTVETNLFMELFGPIIEYIIAIAVVMIITIIGLIIKFIYNLFFKDIYIKIKHRDTDIANLSTVGIYDYDKIKKELLDELFMFKENIKCSKNDNLKNISEEKIINHYEINLNKLADYRCDLFFKEPEVLFCSIEKCETKNDYDYIGINVIFKAKEYITDAKDHVIKGSKYRKRKKYYNVIYRKKRDNDYNTNFKCPKCSTLIQSSNISYCGNCGQKITNIDAWKLAVISGDKYFNYKS